MEGTPQKDFECDVNRVMMDGGGAEHPKLPLREHRLPGGAPVAVGGLPCSPLSRSCPSSRLAVREVSFWHSCGPRALKRACDRL